jgi:hypothetical protein
MDREAVPKFTTAAVERDPGPIAGKRAPTDFKLTHLQCEQTQAFDESGYEQASF